MSITLEVIDAQGRRAVRVDAGPFSIGRSSENQLQLADVQVSRHHAEVVRASDGWHVRDCGSRFGTFVNDARVDDRLLRPGDRVRIGQTEIRVFEDHLATTLSSGGIDFRQMNALLAGLRALGSSHVLDEVLALVLDSALELTGAERGFIFLADESGNLANTLARARGGVTLATAQTSRRIPEKVFATGTDSIVTDLLDDAHAAVHTGTIQLGIRHVLCTPLRVVQFGAQHSERRLGVLYLDSRERGYLQHAGALHALATEAAVVIENARLYREVVERERTAEELRIAAKIQHELLPPPTYACAFAELAAHTVPCRAVGGDFFDYVERPTGNVSFAVGDVAGKGTSAALLTAVVQGLLTAEVETSDGPAQVMERVNRALCRRAVASRFVTAFHAELTSSGDLRYCNAGHNPPFLVTSTGVRRLETGGVVLGVFDTTPFHTGSDHLSPGDMVVMFSDGVTEAESPDGEEFGDARLEACLTSARGKSAGDVLAEVERTLRDFCGSTPLRDDLTVMVVRRT